MSGGGGGEGNTFARNTNLEAVGARHGVQRAQQSLWERERAGQRGQTAREGATATCACFWPSAEVGSIRSWTAAAVSGGRAASGLPYHLVHAVVDLHDRVGKRRRLGLGRRHLPKVSPKRAREKERALCLVGRIDQVRKFLLHGLLGLRILRTRERTRALARTSARANLGLLQQLVGGGHERLHPGFQR